ncbi:transglycosylase family protein, partial [Streptomyces sp. NPDC048623]|uniref:transglycosylase family protein n=1 Tax=Streptomyces sp. NPDC048623 TaxID=3155761 RepID=UPI0034270DC6
MPTTSTRVRTPLRLATTVACAAVAGTALAFVPAVPASAASVETWERVAQCESGQDWTIVSSNGLYYGGLQITKPTWDAFGGRDFAAYPNQASKHDQIVVAERILRGAGPGQWPDCGPKAGLTDDGVDPYPTATPPISQVTGPGARTVLSGTVTLSASVTDQVGTPTGATFLVDGSAVGTVGGHGPSYSMAFDTNGLSDGPHALAVRATNDANQTGPLSTAVSFFTANRAQTTRATGDFNGDGKADVAVLYNNGLEGGVNHTVLWTFLSKGGGAFAAPVKAWDNIEAGVGSWNWDRSKVTAGDFDGDGRADIGILYNEGADADGTNHTALWTFTSTGGGFAN